VVEGGRSVWLRLDELRGVLWVAGDERWAMETCSVGVRMGALGDVEQMGRRVGVGEIWVMAVRDLRLTREFVEALTQVA
jgi:hypothetical protein